MLEKDKKRDYLRRLPDEFYKGQSFVHWSMTTEGRKTGWLTGQVHREIREIMLHTLVRYNLACTIYCLMPDHLHVLWIGLSADSDQSVAVGFFRKYAGRVLRRMDCGFQKQAYDNVLREQDRERDAVVRLAYYISENPSRAGLVSDAKDWEYCGSIMAGYPDMDWRTEDFSERFWKAYEIEEGKTQVGGGSAPVSGAATE